MVTVKDQLLKSIVICLPLFLSFVPIVTLLRMTLVVALGKCFFSVMPENITIKTYLYVTNFLRKFY